MSSRGALFLFLVEGLTEYVVYSRVLTKLCKVRKIKFEKLPKSIKDLFGPLGNRNNLLRKRKNVVYALGDRQFLFLVEGGGFSGVKTIIKEIIIRRNNELQQVIKEFDVNIVVAVDKDAKFRGRISNILRDCEGGACSGAVCSWGCGSGLSVHLFEQGLDDELSTGEFEDLFVRLVEASRPDLKGYVDELDKKWLSEQGKRLNYKRRLFVYLALLSDKPKLRSYDVLGDVVDDVDDGYLKDLFGGVLGLLGCS